MTFQWQWKVYLDDKRILELSKLGDSYPVLAKITLY